ncbi:hypothetical protein GN156_29620, partial [bacterium LRH843]|nr:hypothetical protein [bacterium LRH843]
LVNNGALNPEFMALAEKDMPTLDNAAFKDLLGRDFDTPEQVAAVAKNNVSTTQTAAIATNIMMKKSLAERKEIILAGIKLIKSTEIKST